MCVCVCVCIRTEDALDQMAVAPLTTAPTPPAFSPVSLEVVSQATPPAGSRLPCSLKFRPLSNTPVSISEGLCIQMVGLDL